MDNNKTGEINQAGKRLAKKILQIQLGLWGIVGIATLVLWGREWAIASCYGAVTAIIPQRIFSLLAFAFGGVRYAELSAFAFQLGESVKLFLTMVMFALIFAISGTEPKVVLLSYMLVMLPSWFGPLILKTK